jgi:tetraacyldisaccharide 4'-kinase
MNDIKSKIETIIYDDGKNPFLSLRFILFLLSKLFGSIVSLRRKLYKRGILKSFAPKAKIISVGNITAGGTGKTPFTIYISKLLKEKGYKPAVISRGYGGGLETTGGVVHDGNKILVSVKEAGDEPYLIAEKLEDVPVYVGSNRIKSAKLATKNGADVLVLDDGFQHLKLKRDLEIILLDSDKPFGNGHLIPRGSLRDPLSYLSLGDIFIVTRSNSKKKLGSINEIPDRKMFRTDHKASIYDKDGNPCDLNSIKGRSVFAFSGIASNNKFRASVEETGLTIKDFKEYEDHYQYGKQDVDGITEFADKCDFIVTTEKDFVKIKDMVIWENLLIVAIEIEFIDKGFTSYFFEKLNRGIS